MVATVVQPGDVLVIGTNKATLVGLEAARDEILRQLPGVKVVFIEAVTSMAVYRPDDQREPEGM